MRLQRGAQRALACLMFFGALGGELYDFAGVVRGADDVAPRDAAKAEVQAAAPENPLGELAAEMADVRVKVRGEVLPLVEVVRRATSDAQLREYRELRAEHGGDADGQLALAQWCRRREMAEEEQLHWRIVLAMEPDNLDAIKALGLREFQGMLLTPNEIEQVKREAAAAKKAARLWVPKLKKWKHAIEDGNDKERVEALRQLQLIDDPQALPSLEEIFSLEDAKIAVTLVEVLDRMPHANAADLLAWVAVESKDEYVRQTAAKALEARPYHTYVPKMLARLATPIELSVTTTVEAGGPIQESYTAYSYTGRMNPAFFHKHRLSGNYTRADVAAWGAEVRQSSNVAVIGYQPDRIQHNYVLTRESSDPDEPYQIEGTVEDSGGTGARRTVGSIDELRASIDEANQATEELNKRIHDALTTATKVDVAANELKGAKGMAVVDPRRWWEWWRRHTASNYCFSSGIEVWTEWGPLPIEQVLAGDRVVARNDATGELSLQLVTACDTQAESEMLTIEVQGRVILATAEQPFRITNAGWKPASELRVGMELEGLAGPQRIEAVGRGDAAMGHRLLIANEPNFFVDRHGVLAHDATKP